jgi:peroxiredoxin
LVVEPAAWGEDFSDFMRLIPITGMVLAGGFLSVPGARAQNPPAGVEERLAKIEQMMERLLKNQEDILARLPSPSRGSPPSQVRPGTRPWGPEQATGAPDTQGYGDLPTAWATQNPDGGPEWLELSYEQAKPIQKIRVHCTFNPGALVKITTFQPDGQEVTFWEGEQNPKDETDLFEVSAKGEPVTSQRIKLYLNTQRKSGWNEVDAVELVSGDGASQWAKEAKASSFYGEGGTPAVSKTPIKRRRVVPVPQVQQGSSGQAEPQVGQEAPGFEIKTTDDKAVRLADYRGKYVLLDFWATWCGPCVAETPNLKAVFEQYGKREDFVMIGLSLDQDKEKPIAYAKEKGTQWIDGFLGDWGKDEVTKKYGVRGIPSIWLIGPDGKVVAKGLRGDGIMEAVKKAMEGGKT